MAPWELRFLELRTQVKFICLCVIYFVYTVSVRMADDLSRTIEIAKASGLEGEALASFLRDERAAQ